MAYPYKDLEQLLFKCFLTSPIYIAGTPILLKSLTEAEFDYITETYFYIKNDDERFSYFIAYSILHVEGRNVLEQRGEVIEDLIELVNDWPADLHTEIANLMFSFRKRSEEALKLLEVYCHTDNSRMKWFCYKHKLLNDPQITGWAGTHQIALSSTQQSWITINQVEDDRLRYESINDASRFVATVYHPKGMKKYNEDEMSRRKEEMERKKRLIEEINERFADKEAIAESLDRNRYMTPDERKSMSTKDLIDELNDTLAGKKDEHDISVERYERELKRLYLNEKQKKDKLVVERVQGRAFDPASISAVTRFLDEDELNAEREKMKREYAERQSEAHEESINLSPEIERNLGRMTRLTDEEEDYLSRNIVHEVTDSIVKANTRNDSIQTTNSRRIISPTFEDFKKMSE